MIEDTVGTTGTSGDGHVCAEGYDQLVHVFNQKLVRNRIGLFSRPYGPDIVDNGRQHAAIFQLLEATAQETKEGI